MSIMVTRLFMTAILMGAASTTLGRQPYCPRPYEIEAMVAHAAQEAAENAVEEAVQAERERQWRAYVAAQWAAVRQHASQQSWYPVVGPSRGPLTIENPYFRPARSVQGQTLDGPGLKTLQTPDGRLVTPIGGGLYIEWEQGN